MKLKENDKIYAEIKVENPGEVEMTLSITLPLGEWVAIEQELPSSRVYPVPKFRDAIEKLIHKAKNGYDYIGEFESVFRDDKDSEAE